MRIPPAYAPAKRKARKEKNETLVLQKTNLGGIGSSFLLLHSFQYYKARHFHQYRLGGLWGVLCPSSRLSGIAKMAMGRTGTKSKAVCPLGGCNHYSPWRSDKIRLLTGILFQPCSLVRGCQITRLRQKEKGHRIFLCPFFVPQMGSYFFRSRTRSKSSMMSSTFSRPTEILIRPSPILHLARSSALIPL